ncbi:MAG: helix-turn-helix transcriptional regulator [Blautia sp.]|nr:helix-turn-helix transcriptional regulator [Oliverpabstia sp.]MDY4000510.1 helix-turn-helix transcriptional regulator [Blautia sp.]
MRMEHGYTQLELAQKLGISLRTYQRIEYGEQKPNVHVVIRLQKLFQRNIDILIEETGK